MAGSNSYSFADCQAAIDGPNGSFSLGAGAGPAEEGITISQLDNKGSMMVGADGFAMHSLHMARAGRLVLRVLKTSPVNALLMNMYNADSSSAAVWGKNTIRIADPARGDEVTCQGVAFEKVPDLSYAKDGNTHEWSFNVAQVDYILGTGTPSAQF